MFFKNANDVIPCKMFSLEHFILLFITLATVIIALIYTKYIDSKKASNIIRYSTIFLWILEVIKIIFNIKNYGANEVNKYVPLYFCSIMLYAGILSSFFKGHLKRTGDVFLATGGIIAGLIFLLIPLTSLSIYPMFHFVSIQSFILHGLMIYLGLLILITGYIKLEKKDIIYYSALIIVISITAYIINNIFDSNLMFISQNYPGTFIENIYNLTGKFFTIFMVLAHATLPFYIVYGTYILIVKIIREKTNKNNKVYHENTNKNTGSGKDLNKNAKKHKIIVD